MLLPISSTVNVFSDLANLRTTISRSGTGYAYNLSGTIMLLLLIITHYCWAKTSQRSEQTITSLYDSASFNQDKDRLYRPRT